MEYTDFQTAISSHKKVQVKGEWMKEKESSFDASSGKFTFYMKDDAGKELQVSYDGLVGSLSLTLNPSRRQPQPSPAASAAFAEIGSFNGRHGSDYIDFDLHPV